jgi:hypothetical protein
MAAAGTYITKGDGGSPEGFSGEIAEVVSIGGPTPDSEEIDVTHLRSPARTREYIQSFLIPGEIPMVLNWIPSDGTQDEVNGLIADYYSGDIHSYRITYPDGSTDTFLAYVKNYQHPANTGEALKLNVTLRVTGAVTFVSATP